MGKKTEQMMDTRCKSCFMAVRAKLQWGKNRPSNDV